MRRLGRGTWAVNGCLVLMIALMYLLMNTRILSAAAGTYPYGRGEERTTAALEFTVSWNAAAMGDILDILKEKETHATFMVSGEWVRQNEALARRIVFDGHEIGTLGDTLDTSLTEEELVLNIARGIECIKRYTGARARLYHPLNVDADAAKRVSRALSVTCVRETVDLRCGSGGERDIITRGLNEPVLGGIILLQPTRECANALGTLIDALNAMGITAARVCDVI